MTPEQFNLEGVYSEQPRPVPFHLKLEDQPDGSVKLIAVDSMGKKMRSGDLLSIKYDNDRSKWYVFLHSGVNDELPFEFYDDHVIYSTREKIVRTSRRSSEPESNMADYYSEGGM